MEWAIKDDSNRNLIDRDKALSYAYCTYEGDCMGGNCKECSDYCIQVLDLLKIPIVEEDDSV